MAWPVDGRGHQAPARSADAWSEQEFHDKFIEAVVNGSIPLLEGYGFPQGVDQAQGRLWHATYLKYFSFFAWKFPSWLGAIATRCPYQDVRRTIIEDLVDEEVADVDAGGRCHIDVLYDEAETCGIPREEVVTAEPTPTLLAAVHALENLARTLSWEASFAAISSLEIMQSEPATKLRNKLLTEQLTEEQLKALSAGRSSTSLSERTGIPAESLVFQALHAYKDQFHGGGELALLIKYGTTRAIQEEMLWAATAACSIYAVMRKEIDTLAYQAIGVEPKQRITLKKLG